MKSAVGLGLMVLSIMTVFGVPWAGLVLAWVIIIFFIIGLIVQLTD